MRKIAIALATLVLAGAAIAQPLLTRQDIKDAASTMTDLYKAKKGQGMREGETACWDVAYKETRGIKGREVEEVVAYCTLLTITGYAIESIASENEKRNPMKYWGDDAMAERAVNNAKKVGISESTFVKRIQPAVDQYAEDLGEEIVHAGIGG